MKREVFIENLTRTLDVDKKCHEQINLMLTGQFSQQQVKMQIIGWYRAKAISISDNVTKKSKAIKGSIIFSMKLTNMAKLKSLIKLNNPPEVLIG